MDPRAETNAQPPTPPPPPAKAAPKLAGVTKVAALLLTMDKRLASRLLKHFDEDDIKLIAQTASDLGTIPKSTLDELIEEFASHLKSGGDLMATADQVEELLTGAVPPEQISEIMSQVRSKSLQSIWARLSETPEANPQPSSDEGAPPDRRPCPVARKSRLCSGHPAPVAPRDAPRGHAAHAGNEAHLDQAAEAP